MNPRKPRLVEVRQNILKHNDVIARELRGEFAAAGVFVASLVSSPGAGKTQLLEATLSALVQRGRRVAALVGDLATDNDANRLARSGAPVKQIVTGTVCHLEAEMIRAALRDWRASSGFDSAALDVLFIENVGNLVCPASYDLGEDLRIVLMSTTEGEDKPLKYPTIFNTADLAMITKIDLAAATGFDRAAAREAIERVRPGMTVLETSARRGAGMDQWIAHLESARITKQETSHATQRPQAQPAATATSDTRTDDGFLGGVPDAHAVGADGAHRV